MPEVHAYEAKNKLGWLLALVERGKSSLRGTVRRWHVWCRHTKAVNRDQARAAIRRILERAEKLKLGPCERAEWKFYRNEGQSG